MIRARLTRIVAPAAFLIAGCTGNDTSPVGVELLPENALGGLRVVVSTSFSQAVDFQVFPVARAESDRLTSAHEWPTEGDFESRVIMRFAISAIDSLAVGTVLSDPMLRLVFAEVESDVTFAVHRVTNAWSEEAATWERRDFGVPWNTPGGDFDPVPLTRFTLTPLPPDTAGADTTAPRPDSLAIPLPLELVEGWRTGTIPSHGLILLQETPGEVVDFVARGFRGSNSNGPSIRVAAEFPDGPTATLTLLAIEDTFLPVDRSPFPPGGIVVRGVEPPRRALLEPTLEEVPAGATVAAVRLVLTIQNVEIPRDSLPVLIVQPLSEFQGENTLFAPAIATLAGVTLGTEAQPGDTLSFEGQGLTLLVRQWIANPDVNLGMGLRMAEAGSGSESLFFGGVQFYGPDAPADLRPRLRVVYVPPPVPQAEP